MRLQSHPNLHTKHHLHTVTYTRCHIDTINSPDDGHMAARNMQRTEINIHEEELYIKLVIYKDCTEMHSQQNVKFGRVIVISIGMSLISTILSHIIIIMFRNRFLITNTMLPWGCSQHYSVPHLLLCRHNFIIICSFLLNQLQIPTALRAWEQLFNTPLPFKIPCDSTVKLFQSIYILKIPDFQDVKPRHWAGSCPAILQNVRNC